MIDALPKNVWIRPGSRAAYPSLEAASKGLQDSPPNPDSVFLRSYKVDAETASHLKGVLTDDQGQIPRTVPQRLLDGLCGVGSLTAAVAAGAGVLLSAGSIVGLLVFTPALVDMAVEMGSQGVQQLGRAVRGHSGLATESNRANADSYFDAKTPDQTVQFTRADEEWKMAR